jgi:glyoxylase-like metal-dependent hydrolase (beta-lactamase superfamily II)
MKFYLLNILLVLVLGGITQSVTLANEAEQPDVISKSNWNHGAANCKLSSDPVTDVYQHDDHSFILRQNKCITYEAPFIYVLVGTDKVLVVDTGAIKESSTFSFYTELENILGEIVLGAKEVLVIHSHGHSDHTKGDSAFKERDNVTLIQASPNGIKRFWGTSDWPDGLKSLDLGDRKVTFIPTPGHQEESMTLYDHKTKWLLTGDTLYPGVIYIKDWQAYQKSIDRLATFVNNNDVSAVLGAHIEMKANSTFYYPIGSTYQPDEAKLELDVQSLISLNTKLRVIDNPIEVITDNFIIQPMSRLQKTLSNLVRWFKY